MPRTTTKDATNHPKTPKAGKAIRDLPEKPIGKILTTKEKRFVQEYCIDLDATQASIRAGYAKASAEATGVKLLGEAGIKAAIDSALAKPKKPKTPKTPKKNGRPSIYTQELADTICAELAGGKSMRTVCKQDDMPSMDTVFRWLREKPEFSEQYTKAKAESADALVEEMIDIADNGENDWMLRHGKDKEESWVVNGEHVQRSRLRVETRKWISAKLKPKKYGDKLDMNHGVQPDNPLAKLLEQVTGTKFQVKDQ